MGESVAFPYLACLILRTASGCDIVAVKFPGACPGFPDFKTSLTKFFLEFGKVKALHLLQYAVHGFLDFRFVDFANVLWKSHATLTLLAKQDCPLWLQYD